MTAYASMLPSTFGFGNGVLKELVIPVSRTTLGASAPTNATRAVGASGSIKIATLQFSKVTMQEIYFEVHAPSDINSNTDVHFHLMWIPGAGWTAGNYMWKLDYLVKADSGAVSNTGAPTTIQADVTPANAINTIETEFVTAINLDFEQVLWCRLWRDVANDNADDVGEVRFCEVEYTSKRLGEPI
jgi:hypothetical protein